MGRKYACVPGFLCVIDPAALELYLQDQTGPQVTARLSLYLLLLGLKEWTTTPGCMLVILDKIYMFS